MSKSTKFRLVLSVLGVAAGITACGGQSPPAETPAQSASPSAEPGTSESAAPTDTGAGQGEHTMPDGGTMPGHHME